MQTQLAEFIKDTPRGRHIDRILRKCVHCGFCNATCPTYQLLGDELDGPRGRIYSIKQVLEGRDVSYRTQQHLDRCLTCLNCETTCPSGVRYRELLDLGRELVEQRVKRSLRERLMRRALRAILPYQRRFTLILRSGQALRPFLPQSLRSQVPRFRRSRRWPETAHRRKVLILDGCVQPVLSPEINEATVRVLGKLGIGVVRAPQARCCGAISHHLGATHEARRFMRNNIDSWWPLINDDVEAIVTTASGCGVMVKEYAAHFREDPVYAEKAEKISSLTNDLCEIIGVEDLDKLKPRRKARIAFHAPCSLQHGQQLSEVTERLLTQAGFDLVPVRDAHLCCGSAGTYSILQPALAEQLLRNKLESLERDNPALIATANIGCLHHLQSRSRVPVVHWVNLFE